VALVAQSLSAWARRLRGKSFASWVWRSLSEVY
jgi:hypothetical protein